MKEINFELDNLFIVACIIPQQTSKTPIGNTVKTLKHVLNLHLPTILWSCDTDRRISKPANEAKKTHVHH